MQVTISDDIALAANLSESNVRLSLALALFQEDKLTLAQAAKLADLDRISFQHILSARRIPLHYGQEEFERDVETLSTL